MTILNIKIPENKVADVTAYIQKLGGEVSKNPQSIASPKPEHNEDEISHESFFGENIKRVIRALKS